MAGKKCWRELARPFPCLWNPQDPDFSNEAVKAVCREQLLAICNQQASAPVDMESLKQWLASHVIVKTDPQLQRKLEDMAFEHPCLWNPKDVNYRSYSLRERCLRKLLEEFNRVSADQIIMSDLRRKIVSLHSRLRKRHSKQLKSTKEGHPQTVPVAQSVQSTEAVNEANKPAVMQLKSTKEGHPQTVPVAQSVQSTEAVNEANKPAVMPKLEDLVLKHPCLWNPKNINFRSYSQKKHCRQQLLEEFNSVSANQITMSDLKRKIESLNNRLRWHRSQQLKNTKEGNPQTVPVAQPVQSTEAIDAADKPAVMQLRSATKKCRQAEPVAQRVQSTEAFDENFKPAVMGATEKDRPALHVQSAQEKVDVTPQVTITTETSAPETALSHNGQSEPKKAKKRKKKGSKKSKNKTQKETLDCRTGDPWRIRMTEFFKPLANTSPAARKISCDSTEPFNNRGLKGPSKSSNQPTLPSTVISFNFSWCRLCGFLKNDCVDTTSVPKPYLAKNKCVLTVNDLSAELDFNSKTLPKTICKDCDVKLMEMHDFVKRVHDTQATFIVLEHQKRGNEDSIVVNDTEVDEDVQQRKKFKVTIDFNSDKLPSLSVDNDCIEIDNDEIDLISESDTDLEIIGQEVKVVGSSLSVTDAKANEEFEKSKCGVPVSIISQTPHLNGNNWFVVGPISASNADFKDEVCEQIECEDVIDISSHSPRIGEKNDVRMNSGDEIDSITMHDTFVKEVAEQNDKSKVSVDGNSCDILYSLNGIEIKRIDILNSRSPDTALANEVPEKTDLSSRSLSLDDDHDGTNRIETNFNHETTSNLVNTEQIANEESEERKKRVVSVDVNPHSSPSCNGDDEIFNNENSQVDEAGPKKLTTYTDFVKVVVYKGAKSTNFSIENSGTIKDIKCEDNLTIVDIKKDEDAIYIITEKTAQCDENATIVDDVDIKKESADDIDDVR